MQHADKQPEEDKSLRGGKGENDEETLREKKVK